jgi:hypothetical protein
MVSVSLMSPGEASSYPPPLVPGRPTLDNYRELFDRAGVGRYLLNSVFLAAAVTAVSLVFNVAAGYAFAKLRFAGLVEGTRDGRRVRYRLRGAHVRNLLTEALFHADHHVTGQPTHE